MLTTLSLVPGHAGLLGGQESLCMGKVQGNWLTGGHSGRVCRHEAVYTRINKKTGVCTSSKLCNPNPMRNDAQKGVMNKFGLINAALSVWIKEQRVLPTPSEDYQKVVALFERQTRYSSLRGMMLAKGMYKWEDDGTVTVDVASNTDFKSGSDNGPANAPAAPAEKFTLTLTASPSVGGSVTGAGQYASGEQATIKAMANSGYTFTRWSDGNTNAQRTITISGDFTLQAVFSSDSGSGSGSESGGGSEEGVD